MRGPVVIKQSVRAILTQWSIVITDFILRIVFSLWGSNIFLSVNIFFYLQGVTSYSSYMIFTIQTWFRGTWFHNNLLSSPLVIKSHSQAMIYCHHQLHFENCIFTLGWYQFWSLYLQGVLLLYDFYYGGNTLQTHPCNENRVFPV